MVSASHSDSVSKSSVSVSDVSEVECVRGGIAVVGPVEVEDDEDDEVDDVEVGLGSGFIDPASETVARGGVLGNLNPSGTVSNDAFNAACNSASSSSYTLFSSKLLCPN